MSYFKNKVVLITGGSRGIGYAIARNLVQQGAFVAISARDKERLEKTTKELKRIGGKIISIAGDVSRIDDTKELVARVIKEYGKLDIVINNAGISMRGDFCDLSYDVCEQVISTNLLGSVYVSKAAIKYIIESKGSLVFISSIAGLFGLPGISVYCASKQALTSFTESLRLELAGKGVNIGVVYLGFTENDPEKRVLGSDGSLVPLNRPAHYTREHAASMTLKLLEKRKKQLIMTPLGVFGWIAYRFSPSLFEKIILWVKNGKWGLYDGFRN